MLRRSLALGGALLASAAARRPTFKNLDITGNTQFGSDFSLPDTSGKIRTLADFKGKVVVLFFGYTHCPDVCPTTLAELSQALQQLGDDGKRVQVLMVTVDPARDTPELLGQYVSAFNPIVHRLASRRSRPNSRRSPKDFRVYYAKVPGKTPGQTTRWTTRPRAMCSTRKASCGCLPATARAFRRGSTI